MCRIIEVALKDNTMLSARVMANIDDLSTMHKLKLYCITINRTTE